MDNLQLQDTSTVVFLNGGPDQTRYDSDHEPIFRRESYFLWLNGVQKPDCAVMITRSNTKLFIPRLPASPHATSHHGARQDTRVMESDLCFVCFPNFGKFGPADDMDGKIT